MKTTFAIARYAVDTTYDKLPATTREIAKKDVLDTLASALAGTKDPTCKSIADMVREWHGRPESSVLVYGGRVLSSDAAFVNSLAAHVLDLTDAHEGCATRAGVTVVPAALAVAEARGATTGTDFMTAVAIGLDVVCRMSLAATAGLGGSGFLLSSVMGVFGAAVASAKLLALDEEQTADALGIAYSQAAGNMQAYDDKAYVTRLQNGFAAKAGIVSALLAQRGIRGARNIFSGRYGLYQIYEKGHVDLRKVTEGLGEQFECDNLSFKPYPSMRSTHASIDATLELVRENNVLPDEVEKVTVRLKKRFYDLLCVPLEERRAPASGVAAVTSLPYLIAVAVVRRSVDIDGVSDEALHDPVIAGVASKVVPVVDPALEADTASVTGPAVVEIALKNGRTHSRKVSFPKGGPRNPMSRDEVARKFRRCNDHAFSPIEPRRSDRLVEMCFDLEKVPDIGHIIQLLTPA